MDIELFENATDKPVGINEEVLGLTLIDLFINAIRFFISWLLIINSSIPIKL